VKVNLKSLLAIGVLVELCIVLVAYLTTESEGELFKIAARYSGRLSLVVFLLAFFWFTKSYSLLKKMDTAAKHLVLVFAVLHMIHFGLLATNVIVNDIPLEAHKLAGGALAYLMIVIAPFRLHVLKLSYQLVYFYYVTFVMIMTYIARVKGDFEGAEPFWFHYLALSVLIFCSIMFGIGLYKKRQKDA